MATDLVEGRREKVRDGKGKGGTLWGVERATATSSQIWRISSTVLGASTKQTSAPTLRNACGESTAHCSAFAHSASRQQEELARGQAGRRAGEEAER